jgi:hypothetical protein
LRHEIPAKHCVGVSDLLAKHTAIRSKPDSFSLRKNEILDDFGRVRELRDSAVKIEEHLVEIHILLKKLIQTVLNTLKQVDPTFLIINQHVSKLHNIIIRNTTRLPYFDVSSGKVFLTPWLK